MAEKRASGKALWTKDFTILTIGSVISMIGSSLSGFAIGLLALDETESTFLYALRSSARQILQKEGHIHSGFHICEHLSCARDRHVHRVFQLSDLHHR